jgi:hypothetical protein
MRNSNKTHENAENLSFGIEKEKREKCLKINFPFSLKRIFFAFLLESHTLRASVWCFFFHPVTMLQRREKTENENANMMTVMVFLVWEETIAMIFPVNYAQIGQ